MDEMQCPHDSPSLLLRPFHRKNSAAILVTSLLFVLYFLPYLASTSFGIDTHLSIQLPGSNYNWLEIGRQGAILINKLFLQDQFSLFYVEASACLLYLLSLVLFVCLFDWLARVPAWKTCLFFLLFMVHPIWTEQFYFIIQIFPFAFGTALVPVILHLTYTKKPVFWGAAIPLMVLIFSIYQTFVILYIAGCILCFLLIYLEKIHSGTPPAAADLFRLGIRQTVLFAAAYLINSLITKVFFSSSDYLTQQIKWGQEPVAVCVGNILTHITKVLTGDGVFYTLGFSLSLLALSAAAILFFLRRPMATAKWMVILVLLVLQITPFLLTIYGGTIPTARSQFVLPFTTGCNFLLALVFLEEAVLQPQPRQNRLFMGCSLLVAAMVLAWQYYPASLLQYSSALVQQNDQRMAYSIEEALTQATDGCTKPVAFVGCAPRLETGSFLSGDVAQRSLFSYGWWGDPPYELTSRVVSYMNAQGFPVQCATATQLIQARSYAQSMPSFPAEGSILETDDFIVVKLGPDDVSSSNPVTPLVTQVQEAVQPASSTALRGGINLCELEGEVLSINGWVLYPFHDSIYLVSQIHLWDQEDQRLYTLSCGTLSTPELNELYPENTDYSHCGVIGKAPLNQLPENYENCKIFLSLKTSGHILYLDTGLSAGELISG